MTNGLKKISVEQLCVGMYVEQLCCSWIETPFWQKSFAVDSVEKLDKIRASQVSVLWIDVHRGCDVAAAAGPAPVPPAPPAPVARPLAARPPQVPLAEELDRAKRMVEQSRRAVTNMFQEARMGRAVNVDIALAVVDGVQDSVARNATALIGLARLKNADNYTYMHSVAVCALMIALARQLALDEATVREAGLAGLLHDIGKMAVPGAILNKAGPLTPGEFEAVKTHAREGHAMLSACAGLPASALDVCLHHHEKMDGSGYPDGLAGDGIGLLARMGALCDVYDAVTSNRAYKAGWCPAESLRRMAEWSKSGHFDAVIFAAFVKCVGIYPPGTLVQLSSGRLGVVVELAPGRSLLLPKVRVFYSVKTRAYVPPELLDLGAPGAREAIVAVEQASTWGLAGLEHYWLGDVAR